MNNKLRNLIDSTVSNIMILIGIAGLLILQIMGQFFQDESGLEVSTGLWLGLFIFIYLFWANIMLMTNRPLKPMAPKDKLILMSVSCIFFIGYVCLSGSFVLALIPIWIWVRALKDYKASFE